MDKYISVFSEDVQAVLKELRRVVRGCAPEAQEVISYRMPAFKQNGILVYFAAFKKHIGFYPTPSAIEAFRQELTPYKVSKGAIQFPLGKPIPFELVEKIVKFRVEENLGKHV